MSRIGNTRRTYYTQVDIDVTSGQTVVYQNYLPGTVLPVKNGLVLNKTDYVAEDSASIVFKEPFKIGDSLTLLNMSSFYTTVDATNMRSDESPTGTSDAIVATFNPPVLALTKEVSILVKAAYTNVTETPTLQADNCLPMPIRKGANQPLKEGDIVQGVWMLLNYDQVNQCWNLVNAVRGVGGSSGYSIGDLVFRPSTVVPEGFLLCNGAAISRTSYADLFGVIGTIFGIGNGSTTFNLPDYRGVFLRGLDNGRGLDSGRALNAYQGDAIRNFTGRFGGGYWGRSGHGEFGEGILYVSGYYSNGAGDHSNNGLIMGLDASRQVPTASENRPVNMAVNILIKAYD